MKLLGTEFMISHTFQCERYFSFAKKYHKGDIAGHCPYTGSLQRF